MKQWLCRVGNVGRDGLLGSRYINTTCVFCFLLLTQCGLYGVRVINERYILRSADMIDDCSITDPFILLESIPPLCPFLLPPLVRRCPRPIIDHPLATSIMFSTTAAIATTTTGTYSLLLHRSLLSQLTIQYLILPHQINTCMPFGKARTLWIIPIDDINT